MKIGILSDTHNQLTNFEKALTLFRRGGVTLVVHCGDLSAPETAGAMHGFQVIHVCGNQDTANGQIRQVLLDMNPKNFSGITYEGEVGGMKIAVTHGNQHLKLRELISSGKFDYVFCGHTHRRSSEKIGSTRVINPGALGGLSVEERSVYILDLESGEGEVRFI
jgi:putative phosphoesterase